MITIDKARLRELAERAKQGGYVSESELAYALRDPATVLALLDAYEAQQAELADMERDYLTIIEAQDAEHRKQLDRLQAERVQLRAAIRRLCNIYAVDDYYSGELREERLDRAVNRAIEAVQETNP